ncbi:MAG: S6e family ribosomal protein [archaeon]
MPFKLDIGNKGKTYHLETTSEDFLNQKIGDKVSGKAIKENKDFEDYEFEITGGSHDAGFPMIKGTEGQGLKKVLISFGPGMKKRPKREGKKKRSNYTPKGLKLRKTIHADIITEKITQINLKVIKEGAKKLEDIFKKEEPKEEKPAEAPKQEEKPVEQPKEEEKEVPKKEPKKEAPKEPEKKEEPKPEEKKEESKEPKE